MRASLIEKIVAECIRRWTLDSIYVTIYSVLDCLSHFYQTTDKLACSFVAPTHTKIVCWWRYRVKWWAIQQLNQVNKDSLHIIIWPIYFSHNNLSRTKSRISTQICSLFQQSRVASHFCKEIDVFIFTLVYK